MAEIFDQLGYRVDAIHYNDEVTEIDFNNYDIIFGFGEPLERSFYMPTLKGTIRIYYGTGNHFHFINPASINRVKELYEKTGVLMVISARYATRMWSLQNVLSDAMIVLGNEFTANTYRATFNKNIYTLPASFYKVMNIDLSHKNFGKARNNFLWFGSNGVVHKGLDILLEIFDKRKEINLHICGLKPYESEFVKYYSDILTKRENIKNYGFIELKSPQFAELMMQCAFVIFPSASEGGCASVITVMGNG
ncbi:MAG: glycosyltransferase, partial [Cytophagales bacterium]|nr:glycosyltransferase [Cytophagales bacterium]